MKYLKSNVNNFIFIYLHQAPLIVEVLPVWHFYLLINNCKDEIDRPTCCVSWNQELVEAIVPSET